MTAVNDAPVAAAESYSTNQDVAIVATAPGLLANDTDVDGDTLQPVIFVSPSHGSVSVAADGSFTFTPGSGWSGADSFQYRAFDGAAYSATVTVGITVTSVDTVHTRVEGADRIGTSIAASKKTFPSGAGTVLIATSVNWPDSLGGSSLAGVVNGPILLSPPTGLPTSVTAEITRLGASKAYVLGGTAAVPANVYNALVAKLGAANVTRIGGADRYETANLVGAQTAALMGGSFGRTAFVATGLDFPNALSASPIADAKGWPIYLAPSGGLTTGTLSAMQTAGITRAIVLGGQSQVSSATQAALGAAGMTTERISGSDRYSTGVAIASFGVEQAGLKWDGLGLATGERFPDALCGGPLCGERGTVMLLTPISSLSPYTADALTAHRDEISEVCYLGGNMAISPAVRSAITNLLR